MISYPSSSPSVEPIESHGRGINHGTFVAEETALDRDDIVRKHKKRRRLLIRKEVVCACGSIPSV